MSRRPYKLLSVRSRAAVRHFFLAMALVTRCRARGHGSGVGARRPLTALEGWRDAAERTFLGTEPAADK